MSQKELRKHTLDGEKLSEHLKLAEMSGEKLFKGVIFFNSKGLIVLVFWLVCKTKPRAEEAFWRYLCPSSFEWADGKPACKKEIVIYLHFKTKKK